MDDVDKPFQQLEAAKRQLIMEFKENAKSAQELEFWKRMEIVRDNYRHSQEDSSSGDTTDEEQDDGENLNKDKKIDEKVPDTASDEEITQQKSAAGERADEEKGLKERTVTFEILEMEHGAGDDTPLPQKNFIFQNVGMEHDFNHNATRCESLIDLFENEDGNRLGTLQLTEDKLERNETNHKSVSAEKTNGYTVGIKDLFIAAKKTAKMEARESEKKRKLKEKELKKKRKIESRETERKRKLEENESKKKMIMEAQKSKEKKTQEEKEIKNKRKMDKKKAKNQKKYEKCVAKGDEYESKQKRKEEIKSLQEKNISEANQSKQKRRAKNQKKYEKCLAKGDEYESKQKRKEEIKSLQKKNISEANQSKQKKRAKNLKKYEKCLAKGDEYESKQKRKEEIKSLQKKNISEANQSKQKIFFDRNDSTEKRNPEINNKKEKKEHKSIYETFIIDTKERNGEAKPVNRPKLMDFVRSLVGCILNRH